MEFGARRASYVVMMCGFVTLLFLMTFLMRRVLKDFLFQTPVIKWSEIQASAVEASDYAISIVQSGGFYSLPSKDWENRVKYMERQAISQQRDKPQEKDPIFHYTFMYHPVWGCEILARLGRNGDGGKFICDPHHIPKGDDPSTGCLVYSFGSNNEWSFELSTQITLGCEIHTFDLRPGDSKKPPKVIFHNWGVGVKDGVVNGKEIYSLPTIYKKLGHEKRTIDIMKIDIETAEKALLQDLLEGDKWHKLPLIRQLLVEFHGDIEKDIPIIEALHKKGMYIYSKEVNPYGRCCYEFAFLQLFVHQPDDGLQRSLTEQGRLARAFGMSMKTGEEATVRSDDFMSQKNGKAS